MKKYIVTLFILIFNFTIGNAQKNITDSIYQLKAVQVTKVHTLDNNIGAHTSQLNSALIELNSTQSIGTLLSDNSLIYIKSMGQGGMATASFRGTSSNHTQVNWNGITINPATNGTFDFSLFPTFFTDEVSLYHGSNYLKNGSGALGGSINLDNTNKNIQWDEKKVHAKILAEIGENQTYTGGINTSYTSKHLHSNTRFYYQESDNDFKYENRKQSVNAFKEHRKNSAYDLWGVMQELSYKVSDNNLITGNIWYMENWNQLPQPIVSVTTFPETRDTKDLRSIFSYKGSKEKSDYVFSIAYLFNNYGYEKMDNGSTKAWSDSKLHSAIAKIEYNYRLNSDITFGSSLNYRYDLMHNKNFSRFPDNNTTQLNEKRNIATLQGSILWQVSNPLTFNLQIMGEMNGTKVAPTFCAGLNYELIKNHLNIQASSAYNYRFPTLNDLYQLGGNTDLKAEKGFSYDATINFNTSYDDNLHFKASLSYYLMTIQDWIIWLRYGNKTYLSPKNIDKVLSHGAEIMTETSLHTGPLWHRLFLNYAYSPTQNRSNPTFKGDQSKGKQLPYVPKQKWNARYLLKVKGISFSYGMSYTGKRYTSRDQNDIYSTPSYLIHDTEIGYRMKFKKNNSLELNVRVNNLFDEYHESTLHYPMSLRTWYFSAQYCF